MQTLRITIDVITSNTKNDDVRNHRAVDLTVAEAFFIGQQPKESGLACLDPTMKRVAESALWSLELDQVITLEDQDCWDVKLGPDWVNITAYAMEGFTDPNGFTMFHPEFVKTLEGTEHCDLPTVDYDD